MSTTQVGIRLSLDTLTIFIPEFTARDIARSYAGSATVNLGASGSQLMSGPARRQQYIWAIGTISSKADALLIDQMFRNWDQKRAEGGTPAILVEDNTFGDTVSTYATFSTPPTYVYYSSATMAIDFGLTEVI